jgi:hypothetical protein
MGHLQKDMHSRQQAENARELASLHQVKADILYSAVVAGAFVQCSAGGNNDEPVLQGQNSKTTGFFIVAGLGKQEIDGQTIFFLSPAAPLAKLFHGRRVGERFTFNGMSLLIQDIF